MKPKKGNLELLRKKLDRLFAERSRIQSEIDATELELNNAMENEYWSVNPGVVLKTGDILRLTERFISYYADLNSGNWWNSMWVERARVGDILVVDRVDFSNEEVCVHDPKTRTLFRIPIHFAQEMWSPPDTQNSEKERRVK